MDVFDKFFKKYSYKFPKGYPDMKNEQDVLLLENILFSILEERIVLSELTDIENAIKTLMLGQKGEINTLVSKLSSKLILLNQKPLLSGL